MKNVLFIVYYFPPMGGSGVQRPLKFVKYLRRYGWNPIVLCPEPGAYHTFDESLAGELEETGVEVIRVPGNTPLHKTGKRREINLPAWLENVLRKISVFFWLPDNKKNWIKSARPEALKIIKEKNIDVIFATAAPYSNLMLAADLKAETGLPVVMDLRDEWLQSHLIKYPTRWHRRKMRAIEARTLKQADVITVINKPYKKSFGSRYPDSDIVVIRQGFDPEDFQNQPQPAADKKPLVLLYSGLFYGERKPDLFFRCITELFNEDNTLRNILEFQFQGGLDKSSKQLIRKYGLEPNVRDFGYLNHKEAVKNLLNADILWLLIGHKQHADKVTVGKMFEYFGTKKPILSLAMGGTITLLEEYSAFYKADPDSGEEIKKALIAIINDFKNKTLPVANDKYVAQYNRVKITEELASVFNRVVHTQGNN